MKIDLFKKKECIHDWVYTLTNRKHNHIPIVNERRCCKCFRFETLVINNGRINYEQIDDGSGE